MKFVNLLRKELSELINAQMLASLAVILVLLMLVGNIMETTIEDAVKQTYSINLCDRDDTDFTQSLRDMLKKNNTEINLIDCDGEDYSAILKENKIKNLIIIPEGFTDDIVNNKTKSELISISTMNSASSMESVSSDNSKGISIINTCLSFLLAEEGGLSYDAVELMNNPFTIREQTVVADKSAAISKSALMSKMMIQSMILPIVVFVLIMMTSQTLISAISNEKIDKTLETLLSTPISRLSVIGAKMLAAAIVALINAAVYMFGFSFFVTGATDSVQEDISSSLVNEIVSVDSAMKQLGLSLGVSDYIFIGLQLFLTIMICLSVSLILGAMVNDTKSSQTMIMPIMMLAMVPYLISMLTDINTLPTVIKTIVYAIPFTHTFSAMQNLMFGNYVIFFGGLIYQIVFFIICMFFALKLFKSDKIFTISLNFGQKSKFKKNRANNNE